MDPDVWLGKPGGVAAVFVEERHKLAEMAKEDIQKPTWVEDNKKLFSLLLQIILTEKREVKQKKKKELGVPLLMTPLLPYLSLEQIHALLKDLSPTEVFYTLGGEECFDWVYERRRLPGTTRDSPSLGWVISNLATGGNLGKEQRALLAALDPETRLLFTKTPGIVPDRTQELMAMLFGRDEVREVDEFDVFGEGVTSTGERVFVQGWSRVPVNFSALFFLLVKLNLYRRANPFLVQKVRVVYGTITPHPVVSALFAKFGV